MCHVGTEEDKLDPMLITILSYGEAEVTLEPVNHKDHRTGNAVESQVVV